MSDEYAARRQHLVDTRLAPRGIQNARVLDAMRTVPRHRFVPPEQVASAYEDRPLSIACGQTVSQPYMVALMTDMLELNPEDRVLEVGTGSGYQTAVLATLAREVVSIERHEALARNARDRLARLGYDNITIVCGDGTLGYPEAAPYDAILVTAGAPPEVPRSLEQQLAQKGRLVCPTGPRQSQTLVKVVAGPDGLERSESISCVFVPLIGEEGWTE